ncbi:molybdate ABC transporter permease subunit [Mesorhizobium microcysteis]|jgi:molybdate transport system permease protein|uniref:Molybdenum transport system permease n=1 Tax=Neoaquamicrobium microcysteis TaxID=2682781 RepID=A0A5D4H166_9HYPH|nr:molybdate ABC transporter permease subunit [Mesorhizobium microcysteis]TYR33993.1 molybdate ABC transporter permease subunit [Mesorhizobium microcysteis]
MDWTALWLSLRLAGWTVVVLLPISILMGRFLAYRQFRSKGLVEALVMLPLVLPPTVFGFYLLVAFGANSPIGQFWRETFGHQLVFSFEGLVVASVIFNLPFAIQPAQRGFEAIPVEVREAAQCCGLSPWRSLWKVELPLAWPGLVTAMVLTFAHTLGEFGIVLMVGGSIPGETKTIAIAIYDRVQAFDDRSAGIMSAVLLAISLVTITVTFWLSARVGRRLS